MRGLGSFDGRTSCRPETPMCSDLPYKGKCPSLHRSVLPDIHRGQIRAYDLYHVPSDLMGGQAAAPKLPCAQTYPIRASALRCIDLSYLTYIAGRSERTIYIMSRQ